MDGLVVNVNYGIVMIVGDMTILVRNVDLNLNPNPNQKKMKKQSGA